MKKRPEVLQRETIVDGFIKIYRDRLLYEDRHEMDYFVASTTKDSVIVVAITGEGEFLVTKEYRHAVGKEVYGFAGGLVDAGEDVLESARRELLEETGYDATSYKVIGSFYPLPGLLDQKMTVVLAQDAYRAQNHNLEPSEIITTTTLKKEALEDLLKRGYAADAAMPGALFFLSIASVM